ncbi:unnamed protein product, partial [Scytosiphon promiscuus]
MMYCSTQLYEISLTTIGNSVQLESGCGGVKKNRVSVGAEFEDRVDAEGCCEAMFGDRCDDEESWGAVGVAERSGGGSEVSEAAGKSWDTEVGVLTELWVVGTRTSRGGEDLLVGPREVVGGADLLDREEVREGRVRDGPAVVA